MIRNPKGNCYMFKLRTTVVRSYLAFLKPHMIRSTQLVIIYKTCPLTSNIARMLFFVGATKYYEEDKLIKILWDMYEKEEDDGEEAKRPRHGASTNGSWHPKKHEENNTCTETQMDEDITIENNPTKPLNHNIEKHEENNPGTETQMDEDITTKNNPTKPLDHTIEKIKLEMEENGFEYLPPKAHPKIGYIHYRRQKIDGKLVCVCHAAYYVLLRACAKLVEVDAQTMHRCVLSLERRLEWIDKRIDEILCHQDSGP
ncbi:uncharacterized protein A4U43_C10F3800 [Asparagus officinalis]|uniref:Uncharacterized protein n=1 Tax=Asparagus officinalis TaxID=4686 RepID=A0A5P1E3I6_ASPOF|nr:uncharacterized protein A4U43_C10F3800 [Asparagus officinalis]